jgi:hypothetical protein
MRAAIAFFLLAASADTALTAPFSAAALSAAPKRSALAADDPEPFQKPARPVADPPGGPFSDSLGITLVDATPGATILFTLDGSDPDTLAGTATRVYSGPIRIGATGTLKARAFKPGWTPGDVISETYTLMPPHYGVRAWYLDEDGDGRVEKAMLDFSLDLAALPGRLAFTLDRDGTDTAQRIATGPALAFAPGSRKRVEARFADPFPYGWTSADGARTAARVFAQADPELTDQTVPLYDSAGPVAVRAIARPPENGLDYAIIELSLSEPLRASGSFHEAVLGKKADGTPGILSATRIAMMNAEGTVLSLATETAESPLPGDSLALNAGGSLTDIRFNAPRRQHWIAIEDGGPLALAREKKARSRAMRAQARRYRRGRADYDAKGTLLPEAARVP